MGEVQCKGIMLRNRVAMIEELFGGPKLQAVEARLKSELAEGLRYGTVLSGGWYPLAWLRDLHDAACAELGRGPELARELGYRGAMKNLRTVHRIFLSIMSPAGVLERSQRLFNAYFDGGVFEVASSTPRSAVARLRECWGFDPNVFEAVAGTSQAALELCRASDIRVELELDPRDSSAATIHAAWR
ncbi:MAG: hypothetical protein IT378_01110 [Sandaracinaceae bacterium]|nr:hypothetical protein [Sandaracinaceae bacterium]